MVLTNKDDHRENYKERFEELVKERFDEVKELTNEINQNDLTYYFKGNTTRKTFDDFINGIKLLRKIQSGEVKLEEAKKTANIFKSNLNEISRGWYKSEEQKSTLENIKLLYKSGKSVIKLFNHYSSTASEAKYKIIPGKEISSMLACRAPSKFSAHSNFKILRPK